MIRPKSGIRVREFHDVLDQALRVAVAHQPKGGPKFSCKAGGAYCCEQVVAIGVGDSILLAEHVVAQPESHDWVQRLAKAARELPPTITRREHFRRRIPCVFLDPDSRRCRVYEIRPAPCRLHFAFTPPELCRESEGEAVARPDLRALDEEVRRLDLAIHAENPSLGPRVVAPLPLMVLWALGHLTRGALHRTVRRAAEGQVTPRTWLASWVERDARV